VVVVVAVAAAMAAAAAVARAPTASNAAPLSARSTGSTNNDEDDVESPRGDRGGGGADGDGGGGGLQRKSSTGSLSSLAAPKVSILRDCILLAACAINQFLPTNPKWPVDIFTACLTTPVKVALRYSADGQLCGIDYDMIDRMPGRLTDRKTPLGELNWIFTAVTDTIAWLTLPRPLFQRLFRQDLLVASLFRNFLLAARVMRAGNCTPVSVPALPDTYNHPMWHAWDLAADLCLAQLPQLVNDPHYVYDHSPFFADQLTSFEIWLDHTPNPRAPPAQLPIVLQVLLSQTHRQRALMLLGRFLDVGAWAVNLALSVGIFPYVLKLLQSPVLELRRVLVFIWTKLLALDKSCQLDLVKDNGHNYFINVLSAPTVPPEQRTQAAFVLCCVMSHCRPGQQACLSSNLLAVALAQINDSNAQLRRWCVFCLGRLWEQHEDAKRAAVHEQAHERLCALLTDDEPDVRAAVVWALAAFIGGARDTRRANIELNIGLTLMVVTADGSHLVRRELVFALARLVQCFQPHFIGAHRHMLGERERAKREAELLAMSPSDGGAASGATASPDTLRRVSRESNDLRRVSRDAALSSRSALAAAMPESPGIKRAPLGHCRAVVADRHRAAAHGALVVGGANAAARGRQRRRRRRRRRGVVGALRAHRALDLRRPVEDGARARAGPVSQRRAPRLAHLLADRRRVAAAAAPRAAAAAADADSHRATARRGRRGGERVTDRDNDVARLGAARPEQFSEAHAGAADRHGRSGGGGSGGAQRRRLGGRRWQPAGLAQVRRHAVVAARRPRRRRRLVASPPPPPSSQQWRRRWSAGCAALDAVRVERRPLLAAAQRGERGG
jgi:hypothetical protein